ncbi:tape measure protein [uncultured Sphingomonas sp.]|uniref:tape measure protein n=1 Tax=uncultured Sphingomonas sp. TaxID=158754 RepID=UPI0025944CF2|nr:tape measure protein [uncultured Sphingomonas sp.]
MTATTAGTIVYNVDLNSQNFINGMSQVDKGLAGLDKGFGNADKSGQAFAGGLNRITQALVGLATVKALEGLQKMSEEFTVLRARIDRFSGGVAEGAENYERLLAISSKTGSDMGTAVKTWEALTGSLKEMGKSNDDVLKVTDSLMKMGVIGGSSAEEMKNGLRQLSQSFAGGIVRGEEFNSVLENTPEIARQIAKGMGISFSSLRKEMLDSKLTAEVVFEAIQKRSESVNADFEKMPRTVAQAANSIQNEFGSALSKLDKESGFSKNLAKAIDLVASKIAAFGKDADAMANALDMIAGAASSVAAVMAGRVLTSFGAYAKAQYSAITATMGAIEANRLQIASELQKAQALHAGNLAELERSKAAVAGAAAAVAASRSAQAAEIMRMESTIGALQAEKTLEAQRLKSQISEKGRMATVARMAELQTAELALTRQLTAAQGALASTTVSTSAAMTAALNGRAAASEAAAASAARVTAATAAMAGAASGATVVMNGLKTAMAFLGGPVGIIMLAAMAIYQFGFKADEARPKVDLLTESIDDMGNAMLKLNRIKVAERIEELKGLGEQSVVSAAKVETLKKNLAQFPGSPKVAEWTRDLAEAEGASETAGKELAALQERMKAIDDEVKKRSDQESKPQEKKHKTSDADQKVIDNLKDQAELAKLAGAARARLAAEQKLSATATAQEKKEVGDLAVKIYELETAKKEGKKATAKEESAAAAQRKKDAADEKRHLEENVKAISDYGVSIGMAAMKGEDLARAQAVAKLNKFATKEDVATMEALGKAMYDVQQVAENKKKLASVDPMAAEDQNYEDELTKLRELNDAKILEDQRYNELKLAATQAHDEQVRAIEEAAFIRQSEANKFLMNTIDALGNTTTQVFSGILSGTMNAQQAMQAFGQAIFQEAIGALVQMGVQSIKTMIIQKSASAAASAAYVAGVSAQVATTTALAGQAAFASTAAIPVVGPAAAPAAATAATMAASALGAPAITASAGVAGGRLYGGDVNAGSMYAVTEDGSPEIFQSDNGKQYMLPGTNGEVISNKNASGGGGMIVNININVDSGGESSTSTSGGGGAEELAEKFRAMTLTIMQEETAQGGILWNMQNERY